VGHSAAVDKRVAWPAMGHGAAANKHAVGKGTRTMCGHAALEPGV
jgi:hypothetical protein